MEVALFKKFLKGLRESSFLGGETRAAASSPHPSFTPRYPPNAETSKTIGPSEVSATSTVVNVSPNGACALCASAIRSVSGSKDAYLPPLWIVVFQVSEADTRAYVQRYVPFKKTIPRSCPERSCFSCGR